MLLVGGGKSLRASQAQPCAKQRLLRKHALHCFGAPRLGLHLPTHNPKAHTIIVLSVVSWYILCVIVAHRPGDRLPRAELAPARACVAVVAQLPGDRLPRVGFGLRSRFGAFQPCGRWSTRRLFTCRPRPLFLRCAGLCPLQPSRCGGGARSNARLRLARACVAVEAWRFGDRLPRVGLGCDLPSPSVGTAPSGAGQITAQAEGQQGDGGDGRRAAAHTEPWRPLLGAVRGRGEGEAAPEPSAASGRLWRALAASKRGTGAPSPPPLQGGIPAPPGRAPGPPEGGRRWYGYPAVVSTSKYPSAVSR